MITIFRRIAGAVFVSCILATSAHAVTEKVLYRFKGGPDGVMPAADLLRVGSTLYGTTRFGGGGPCNYYGKHHAFDGCGIVFAITPTSKTAFKTTLIHSFQSGSDGAYPFGGLINVNGTFYGTTAGGGAFDSGTLFSLTPSGVETVLYSFKGGSDGAGPSGNLIEVRGVLYGTTGAGGQFGYGTAFAITTAGKERVLHSFGSGDDGLGPVGGVVNVGGTLYGMTTFGGGSCDAYGATGCGTIYSLTRSGDEAVLHAFKGGDDGEVPRGESRLLAVNGNLYGTTIFGGGYNHSGTVFSATTTGIVNVLYGFTCGPYDNCEPQTGLMKMGQTLYGTTVGSVYSITPAGVENDLYIFQRGRDGYVAGSGLTAMNGKIYGVTVFGGGKGCRHVDGRGTIFEITL